MSEMPLPNNHVVAGLDSACIVPEVEVLYHVEEEVVDGTTVHRINGQLGLREH